MRVEQYEVDLFDCPKFSMMHINDCPRANNILHDKSFEPTSMKLWCHLARQATSILDIGAHVGVYSLAAAMMRRELEPAVVVHAFEPNPFAYARLREHLRINELMGRVMEHHYALSDKEGLAPFAWAKKPNQPISSGGAIALPHPQQVTEIYPVMTTRLDIAMNAHNMEQSFNYGNRPLVKIDVEGGEVEVFRGATKLLAAKPDIILECFDPLKAAQIWAMLPSGYTAYAIRELPGDFVKLGALCAMSTKGADFNQFLTTRSLPAL